MSTEPVPAALADLGRYRLLQQLGQGGMGTVYLAEDKQLARQVAVKVLPPGRLQDADAVARFQREARALAQLAHPGIVRAFDFGAAGDQHFFVMEYVAGESLAQVLIGTVRSHRDARPTTFCRLLRHSPTPIRKVWCIAT